MTLQEVLFKPFVPPPVTRTWKHLADGYEEPEKYRPKGDIAKAIDQRKMHSIDMDMKILDFIRRNPACTRTDISNAVQLKASRTAERMNVLLSRGKVVCETRCKSNHGGAKTHFYWLNKRVE